MEVACVFGTVCKPDYFRAFWIENEVMKWRGDRVWYKIVDLGVRCSVPHSTAIRFLVVFFNTNLFLCVLHFLKILVAIFILFICALWYSKWCNINKCTVLCFMHTIFYIAPTCFGAIISTSSEHWYLHFFISKHNSPLSETAS
jgi:hypothetical protein